MLSWAWAPIHPPTGEHRTDTSQVPLIRHFKRLNYQNPASTEIKSTLHLWQKTPHGFIYDWSSFLCSPIHTHTHTPPYTPLGCSPEATNYREGLSCPLPTLCSHSLLHTLTCVFPLPGMASPISSCSVRACMDAKVHPKSLSLWYVLLLPQLTLFSFLVRIVV